MKALAVSDTVAVIGAGTMGAGIAQVAAAAGHPVLLHDAESGAVKRGIERTAAGLRKLVERGRTTAGEVDALLARIRPAADLAALAPARLVIEAIVERLDVKQSVFRELERVCAERTILASNTSSISVTAIAAGLARPGNVVGMHFFNPAPIMKLVEIISGIATDPAVAGCVHATSQAWGKQPVYARSTPGFIVNRIARPFYGESLRMLAEGTAGATTIDTVLRDCGGFRMGPFELMDLIGIDVNFMVTKSVYEAYFQDPKYRPSLIQQEMVNAGYFGRKSGRGFYRYDAQEPAPAIPIVAPQALAGSVTVHGSLGPAEPLATALESRIGATRNGGDGFIHAPGVVVALTDGRTATRRSADESIADLVLFDLALDYGTTPRIVLAAADQASQAARDSAAALFQALGKQVTYVDDTAGMILMRILATLANEAADAVGQGVCTPADADTAMLFGVNYPRGPMDWADSVGLARLDEVLANLGAALGTDRYRASALLRRRVAAQRGFLA
ncbi:MAG: 3-hydroxyacyl-CoA dehydrogenase [Gammaproteobacteria bacterium]|nr:3-hydroxyacyl-CoA dehydrogenase [Gammaproteobacteria bacterium]